MNTYKNKNFHVHKFIVLSTLFSSFCVFSNAQDSNALMKFLREIWSGFKINFTGNSKSYNLTSMHSSKKTKFTPLNPTSNLP